MWDAASERRLSLGQLGGGRSEMQCRRGARRLGVWILAAAVGTAVSEATAFADEVVASSRVSSFVNVRKGPSTATAVIGRLSPGDRATLLGDTTRWYNVELSSHVVGWVSKAWTETRPAPTPTPSP